MDTVELLTNFGLTRQEATIYMTLFCEGSLTGYEAAKQTRISRSNTYTALAGLVEKGAALIVEGTATRYTPVLPDEFCNNKILQMQEYRTLLVSAMPDHCKEVDGYITIQGKKHILRKMKNMLTEAKERVYLSISKETAQIVLPELKSGVERGIKVVVITNAPFCLDGAVVYHAETNQDQIRLIADSTCVLTGDISDGENSTCLYSKKKNLIDLFKESLKNEIKLIELTERNRSK